MSSNDMGSLPGAGAMNDTLEFVRNMWGAMKIPGMSMPSMSPDDINKQIADLKAVESWLQMNMNMLRTTIQTLEVQSATLSAIQTMGQSFASAGAAPPAPERGPAFESPFEKPASGEQPAASMPDPAAFAAQFANPAVWWNTVQDQFAQAVQQVVTTPVTPPGSKPAAKKTSAAKKTATAKKAGTARRTGGATRSTKKQR